MATKKKEVPKQKAALKREKFDGKFYKPRLTMPQPDLQE